MKLTSRHCRLNGACRGTPLALLRRLQPRMLCCFHSSVAARRSPTRHSTTLPALLWRPGPTRGQKARLQRALPRDPKKPGAQGRQRPHKARKHQPFPARLASLCAPACLPACCSSRLSPCPWCNIWRLNKSCRRDEWAGLGSAPPHTHPAGDH